MSSTRAAAASRSPYSHPRACTPHKAANRQKHCQAEPGAPHLPCSPSCIKARLAPPLAHGKRPAGTMLSSHEGPSPCVCQCQHIPAAPSVPQEPKLQVSSLPAPAAVTCRSPSLCLAAAGEAEQQPPSTPAPAPAPSPPPHCATARCMSTLLRPPQHSSSPSSTRHCKDLGQQGPHVPGDEHGVAHQQGRTRSTCPLPPATPPTRYSTRVL
jgi:hypothetical protein